MIGLRIWMIKKALRVFFLYRRHIIHVEFKEVIHSHFVNMWSWIYSYHIMCLSFHVIKEIIEGIMNDTRETYWNLCGQLINHCINNPLFNYRSKHIDTRFHYLWDCIANKKVKVKYVKIKDQAADIFIKPLKYDVFIKMRDLLGVMKKSSLKRDVESKLDFNSKK